MFKKARVIIVSILLIAALSIALREHISWEKLASFVGIQSATTSLPAHTDQSSSPTENFTAAAPSLANTDTTLSEPTHSSASSDTDEPQIIPTFDVIEQVLSTNTTPQRTRSVTTKKSRTRRRKKTAAITTIEPDIKVEEHKAVEEPAVKLPTQEAIAAEESAPLKNTKPKKEIIRIHNKINIKELAVKHWTGTYSPTKLEITLNGIPFTIVGKEAIDLHAAYEIPHAENRITAEYSYEFLNGMRKGSDTIIYTITENAPDIELHFSWDTPWHVELNGAQRVDTKN